MRTDARLTTPFKIAALYTGIALSVILLTCVIMQIWHADLSVPFRYNNDAPMVGEWIKSIVDNGWYIRNPYIGMPEGKDLGDVPNTDNLNFLIMKLISFFTGDWALIMNLFFLLFFPLIAITTFYVLRQLRLSTPFAYAGAILYSFMHYHFTRGVGHITLSAYCMVPIGILISLWILSGEMTTESGSETGGILTQTINKKKLIVSLIACAIIASMHVYYSYFTCMLLSAGGAIRSVWDRNFKPAAVAALLIAAIVAGGLLNLSPQLIHQIRHGKNREASARVYHEVELYGLKIIALLMPASGHRIPLLAKIKNKYAKESTFVHEFTAETESSSIGFLAGGGFMLLILFLILYRNRNNFDDPLERYHYSLFHYMSLFNIILVLVSMVGGFSSFIAFIIRYMIRAYARTSLYIAFLSIAAVLIILQHLYTRYGGHLLKALRLQEKKYQTAASGLILFILLGTVTTLALLDQTSALAVPDYKNVSNKFYADRSYVSEIEKVMPERAMVFQLPYMGYPETKPPGTMDLYDHFRGYLHSNKLRWSYGVVRGRETDAWQKKVSAEPVPKMLRELSAKGFAGLYVNRNGYPDRGEALIAEIRRAVGAKGLTNNQDLVFFDIRNIR